MTAFEKHYSPAELAELWGVSRQTIYRWFGGEPDVLRMTSRPPGIKRLGRAAAKRDYVGLRIPASVAARVWRLRSVA